MEKILINLSENYPIIAIVLLGFWSFLKYNAEERKKHKAEIKEMQEKMESATNEKIKYLEKEIEYLSKKNVASAKVFEERGKSFDESTKAFQKAIEEFSKISVSLNSLVHMVEDANEHMDDIEENLSRKIEILESDVKEIKYMTKNK